MAGRFKYWLLTYTASILSAFSVRITHHLRGIDNAPANGKVGGSDI